MDNEIIPFWEKTYQDDSIVTFSMQPNRTVVEFEHLLDRQANILEADCGEGQNAVYLARKGFQNVDAFDILGDTAVQKLCFRGRTPRCPEASPRLQQDSRAKNTIDTFSADDSVNKKARITPSYGVILAAYFVPEKRTVGHRLFFVIIESDEVCISAGVPDILILRPEVII